MTSENFNKNAFVRKEVQDGATRYYNEEGQLHRDDGPASIEVDDKGRVVWIEFSQNGKAHREGAPAIITTSGSFYYRHGKLHRDDGPAIEAHDLRLSHANQWWINGVRLTKEQFDSRTGSLKICSNKANVKRGGAR